VLRPGTACTSRPRLVFRFLGLVVRGAHDAAFGKPDNAQPVLMAAPIVGEKIMGALIAWRSFQATIRRSASSST
jgi:hypothetical protein